MNTARINKNTSASAKAITAKAYFTTEEVADMLNFVNLQEDCGPLKR